MKKNVLLAIGFLFLISPGAQATSSALFEEGNAKYHVGDFKAASESYQKLIERGQATGAVYYNLGNAALKSGEKGRALVYYERALKALPRDKDLRWNIHILQEALPDRIEDTSYFAIASLRDFLSRWSVNEIAILFSVFLAVLTILTLTSIFFPAIKPWTSWIGSLAVLGLLVVTPFFGFKVWEMKDPQAVVLDKETYAYYGPSERETKAFLLHEGAYGKIIDKTDDWFYLVLPNKKMGWIRKNSCEVV